MAKKVVKKTITTVEEVVETTDKTQIVCVLDSSGSMSSIISDAIGGFNEFLKKQKELDGEATLTVALFDSAHNYQMLYDNVDIQKVESITDKEWYPRGMTALYDSIGKTINHVDASHKKLSKDERPDKVLVAIVTDGHENDSHEFNSDSIKKLIKSKEKNDWQFVYLAADQNAFEAGTSIGVAGGNTLKYTNTSSGNAVVFDTLNSATRMFRSKSISDRDYVSYSANVMNFASGGVGEVGEKFVDSNTITTSENTTSLTIDSDATEKKSDKKKDK